MPENIEIQKKAIADKLKSMRKAKEVGYQKFAIEHGFEPKQYWRIEENETNITIKTLLRVLEIHDVTLKDFVNSL